MLNNDQLHDNYDWGPKIPSTMDKQYQIGKHKQDKHQIIRIIHKNIAVDKPDIQRKLNAFDQMSNDYLVKILSIRSKTNRSIIDIFYEYFPGISLKKYFEKQLKNNKNIREVIIQVVIAMRAIQQKQSCHLRINHNSIIINQQNQHLKIVDYGPCSNQYLLDKHPQSSMYRFLHPKILFDQINPYKNFSSSFDIWSFGIVLYEIVYNVHPFSDQNGNFCRQKLNTWVNNSSRLEFINNQRLPLINQMLPRLISCSVDKFQTWRSISAFLQGNLLVSQLSFSIINNIFPQQIRLIFLFTKIYIMIIRQVKFKSDKFWIQNSANATKFAIKLVYICEIFQTIFQNRFKHLQNQLTKSSYKQQYILIHNSIATQLQRIQSRQFLHPDNCHSLIENFKELSIEFSTRFQKPFSTSVLILSKFCNAFITMCKSINNIYFRYLQVAYQSSDFKELAQQYFKFKI